MAGEILSSSVSTDQEKYLAAKLLQRSYLKLVAASLCDKVQMPQGAGTTSYFVRYKRMNVPVATLTEGVKPSNSSISVEQVTGSLDQWGDMVTITDVAVLTTKHPLLQIATTLLSDNAQRVIDREVQIVMLAGTNVQYGDGSVTTRATVTTSMTVSDKIIHKAKIAMLNAGVPTRDGPSNMKENAAAQAANGSLSGGSSYVAVCGPEVSADIQSIATSAGLWGSVHIYQDKMAIYAGETGTYLGLRWVETNFIPRFARLGNTTAAAAVGSDTSGTGVVVSNVATGGSLKSATTFFWKVTRKDLTRGFEEDISIAHSTGSGGTSDNEIMRFTFPSTAGYVYNLYFDTDANGGAGTDATLRLVSENIVASAVVDVSAVPTTGAFPPGSNNVTGPVSTVYPVYVVGAEALAYVGFQNLKTYITGEAADKADPLGQVRTIGYKFMAKALIKDQTRLLRLELASSF